MCTVTLTPLPYDKRGFVITSNRDEAPGRETLPPKFYHEEGQKMLFPKDVLAGGTWLGLSEQKRGVCLLNGGFKKHFRKSRYRLSRGVVVKHLLAAEDFQKATEDYDFSEIEPFTIVALDWQQGLMFFELVWDGEKSHFRNLPLQPHIWSSSPLYSEEMKQLRESWFLDFRRKNELQPENLLEFHTSAGIGDENLDIIMDRGFVKTLSVSQIVHFKGKIKFYYKNLVTGEVSKMSFSEEVWM
ncbi:MAG: NRDE family protein [Salinimicrobium sp.]